MKNVNSDVAHAHIRKRILGGVYRPGQPLMTNELSAEIRVSRTPVRDALRQLEADGLVVIRPHLGARVKTKTFIEYREMRGLRLTGLLSADALENRATVEELRREDVRFHIGIIGAAKSELLRKEVLRLHIVSRVVAGPTPDTGHPISDKTAKGAHRRDGQASHDEIYRAIEKGNAGTAKSAMERHIQDIIDSNMRLMARADKASLSRELRSKN